MGIQRKPQRSLQDLIESQLGRSAPGKSTQPKFAPPPPKSPLPPPSYPPLPSRPDLVDPKKKREQKGKDVAETGRSRAEYEDETHQAAKQQKTGQTSLRGMEKGDNRPLKSQA